MKQALRDQVRAFLKLVPQEQRMAASARARALLEREALWQRARSVMFFAPLPGELDVWPLLASALASGRQVALPLFVAATRSYEACWILNPETDVRVGHFGIREPCSDCARVSPGKLDLILVPGVAFDLQGRRLGRGKGYYDQLLGVWRGTACGVAFDEQIVDEIPMEPHDVPMNCILTPNLCVAVKARGEARKVSET
jgi:5-formyltetrahydrofolate cyclo-ligase